MAWSKGLDVEAGGHGVGAQAPLPLDPYLVGILLAEGSLEVEGISFASDDVEIVERVRAGLPPGHTLLTRGVKHRVSIGLLGRANKNANLILAAIRDLGLIGHRSWEKFIPEVYKFASAEDRVELLRGYLDGDGSIKADGNIRVSTASNRLAEDVQWLVRSLGGDCKIVNIPARLINIRASLVRAETNISDKRYRDSD